MINLYQSCTLHTSNTLTDLNHDRLQRKAAWEDKRHGKHIRHCCSKKVSKQSKRAQTAILEKMVL